MDQVKCISISAITLSLTSDINMKREKRTRWIFFSIFYPESQWHELLKNTVIPFFKEHQHSCVNCIIHFGNNKGSYIGFSLEVSLEKCKAFVSFFYTSFYTFLQIHTGSEVKPVTIAEEPESVFMNFPVNSICHSLHKFPIRKDRMTYTYINTWHQSTIVLLRIFGTDPFDKEDLFTAALYLNLSLLLSFKEGSALYFKRDIVYSGNDSADSLYIEKFNETLPVLIEILEDCYTIVEGTERDDLKPISEWHHLFKMLVHETSQDAKEQAELIKDVLAGVRQQLGVAGEGKSLIDFFVKQLFYTRNQSHENSIDVNSILKTTSELSPIL